MALEIKATVGYGLGTGVRNIESALEEAKWGASVGFESFWISQIFGVDPIVALAVIGREVPEIKEFGTSVVPLAGRHPLALASSARTASAATKGRFTLGIGPSHKVVVEHIFGESYERPFTWTKEFVEALSPLLNDQPADVSGQVISAHGSLTIDSPRCPLLLAALGPKMLRLAGALTDGTSLGSCGPKMIRNHVTPVINEAASVLGRPSPRIQAMVSIAVTDNADALREEQRRAGAGYDQLPTYRRALDLEGVASGADLSLLGSWNQIEEGLNEYVAAGVTDLRIMIGASDTATIQRTREALTDALA
jgi:5,10-methylenetetrahydromethanopterin reductase